MGVDEIYDMILAAQDWIDIEFDRTMQITAWQTALIMNSSGNYKTSVKPEKLYESLGNRRKKEKKNTVNKVDINKKREELLKTFGLNEGSFEGNP